LKPKRASKVTKTNDLKCEFEGCGKTDIDLTKCNMCNKWVCETCNDIQAAKLKPITNKCRRVYFICKSCDENIGTENVNPNQNVNVADNSNVGSNLLTSLKKMLDTKVSQLETKIEKVIDTKLGDKMDAVKSLNEKIKDNDEVAVIPSSEKSTYSQIFAYPKK
jgi:molybdopterin converting factor small subunit